MQYVFKATSVESFISQLSNWYADLAQRYFDKAKLPNTSARVRELHIREGSTLMSVSHMLRQTKFELVSEDLTIVQPQKEPTNV